MEDEMFVAVQEGNEGRIATLLDTDPALLEAMDGMKNTPVIVAANDGELGVVRLLVQRGANIHATGHSGRTALHVAALMDFEVVAAFLLGSGAHASCKDKQGCTPLILASSRGLMGAVDVLVEHLRASGTDLEEGDAKGRTALHWAAEEGQELVVAFLLRSGAQAGCSDNGGVTPLMLASGKGLGGVAHLLVEYLEAPGLEQRDAKGRTALHWAAEQGQELMVAFLLRNGAQAESSAPDGMTPLMCASCKGHVAVVRVLAQHMSQEGLGLEQRDAQASTALHWATINGHADVIRLLLKNGAQATCRDVWGNTPLMTAAYHNQMPAVRILLSVLGIQELDEADTRGWTALHLAARSRGGEEIVRLLLLHGADPSRVDHRGQTPRAAAQRLQRETCVAVFEWWEGELERRQVLSRATRLHRDHATHRDDPTSTVPAYLEARVAAGHALPSVEVVSQVEKRAFEGGKRQDRGDNDEAQGTGVGEDEIHAVLEFVLKGLNGDLLTELLERFQLEK